MTEIHIDHTADAYFKGLRADKETKYPATVILPTHDLLGDFFKNIGGEILPQADVNELLAQIICVLLDSTDETEMRLRELPDINRIVSTAIFPQIKAAVPELALAIRDRLLEYGAFKDNNFPYFFHHVLGRDIVLSHLPY